MRRVKEWRRVQPGGLLSYFLPAQYPHSVGGEYSRHQAFHWLRQVCSSASYVLATQALLAGAGVGHMDAALGSIALNWVLREGVGAAGVIGAAHFFSSQMDGRVKRARWLAEVAAVCGVAIEVAAGQFFFSSSSSVALYVAVGAAAQTIKGVAALVAGAARAHVHQHLARHRNLADVTARSHAQALTGYLCGVGVGAALMTSAAGISPLLLFGGLSLVQLAATERALSSLRLRSLDVPRTTALAAQFCRGAKLDSPRQMAQKETFVREFRPVPVRLHLGAGIRSLQPHQEEAALQRHRSLETPYLLWRQGSRIHVGFRPESTAADALRSVVDAVFEGERGAGATAEQVQRFCEAAEARGWTIESPNLGVGDVKLEWN